MGKNSTPAVTAGKKLFRKSDSTPGKKYKKHTDIATLKDRIRNADALVVATKIRHIIIRLAYYLVVCSLAFVFLYPFIKLILNSLMTESDLINLTVTWIPTKLEWSNYKVAFERLGFSTFVWNSLTITVVGTIGHLLSCSLAGYAFARYNFRFKGVLFVIVILSMLVPVQVTVIPSYIMYSRMNLLNAFHGYLPLLLPCFFGYGLNGAFFIFLFRQFFSSLPKEMEDAARVDGCGCLRTYFQIMLPMSRSAVLVATVLSVVWHWNDYFEPNIYISDLTAKVLPSKLPGLYQLLSNAEDSMQYVEEVDAMVFNEAMLDAGVFMVILPLLIIYMFLQKQFMEGIEHSGLTGM